MNIHNKTKIKGDVLRTIEYKNGTKEAVWFHNTVLNRGRMAITASLSNQFGDSYQYFIQKMIFGDGGTDSGTERFVTANRESLFGVIRSSKPVIARIDNTTPSQLILTAVLPFDDDSNGYALNEMALQMANSQLYSMVTFPDLNKTSAMQITWSWRLSFL